MDDTRIPEAMARIEKALERIERAAQNRPEASASTAQLVARHEALRESVSSSIAQLDTLIGSLEK